MDSRPAYVAQSIKLLLAVLCASFISVSVYANSTLPEYNAVYYVEKLDNIVGRATFQLEHTDSGLHYSQRVEVIGLAALFMDDKIEEDSWLKYDDEKLLLEKYQYLHKGSKDNRNVILDVTWETPEQLQGKATGTSEGKEINVSINAETRDSLSFQLSMMMDAEKGSNKFKYPVLAKGELKQYKFKITKKEQLQINNKTMNTIQVERKDGNRLTRLWLAPELHYIPVKVQLLKDGEVDSTMTLDKINFTDKLSSL